MKLFSHGILGMNARNLGYIRTKNTTEGISLADSKLKTKHFLTSRGIPFAETYFTLSTQQELQGFLFKNIRSNQFVIKPNKGSGGKGILIVNQKNDEYYVQDEVWTEDELKLHMIDILHGSFSLYGSSDTIVIEELLAPGSDFSHYCTYGLADIRVIVYNLVPITAMIRVPTIHSGGKANLAQGGIGLGLNIANGQVISLFQNKKIHTQNFPLEYSGIKGKVLPFWDDILLYSSQVQMYTKLGYLALDWVITKNGPKLLEINARAGLEIQNVNLVPLASRLKKVEDIKVLSPEKGVEIAKTLFHTETMSDILGKKILYLEQKGIAGEKDVAISVDISRESSMVSKDITEHLGDSELHILTDTQVSIRLGEFDSMESPSGTIILGRKAVENYLLHPVVYRGEKYTTQRGKWAQEILEFDDEVYKASKKVNLSSLLRPDNYFLLLDAFIQNPGGYNPVFQYHFPSQDKIRLFQENLKILFQKGHDLKQKGFLVADLYIEKLSEMENKMSLVEAYKEENLEKIAQLNNVLFGKTDASFLQLAKERVLESGLVFESHEEHVLGKILSLDEIMSYIHRYFESHHIEKIPISVESGNLSRMSVSYGKTVKIHVSKNATIREKEMGAILSHEIGTHFRRYLNGRETGLKLFQFGTGYYLSDEEGFAIHHSFSHLPEGHKKNAMYIKYYLLSVADTLSFDETINLLRSLYPEKPSESLFSDAVRLKRGIAHTELRGTPGTTYQKDKIYLDGYMRVKDWIEKGGDPNKLLYGKIKIQDIKILELL